MNKAPHEPRDGSEPRPSDSPSDLKTLAWTSSTYFAEGLPWSILHQVAAEFFTAIGVSPAGVGRTSLLHGPMMFKMVWSPFVEMWGSLRRWMVGTQIVMGVLVGLLGVAAQSLSIGFVRAQEQPGTIQPTTAWVWGLLLAIGILSAFHDIACDGFYMEGLDVEKQARFSGLRVAAYRAAMLVGSAGLVVLGGRYSWLSAFVTGGAILLALGLFHQVFLPHPRVGKSSGAERSETGSSLVGGRAMSFSAPYRSFFSQDSVILVVAFLVLYKMADVLMFSMSSVFLGRELGIGTDLRGVIRSFSVISSIFGAVVGGAWIARRGLDKTLFWITILMVATEPLYALLATFSDELSIFRGLTPASLSDLDPARDGLTLSLVTLVIVVEQIFGGFATAAQVIFIMRRCHIEHRTAHFAFSTAIISLTHMGLGVGSGVVYEAVGPESYFWIVSALALPAVGLSLIVPTGALAGTTQHPGSL